MKPWTLLVICGVAVAGFAVGRFTASDNKNDGRAEHVAEGDTAAAATGGEDDAIAASRSRGTNSSWKLAPLKSTTELRDELDRLSNLSSVAHTYGSGALGMTRGCAWYTKYRKELTQTYDRLATSDVKSLIDEYAKSPYTSRDEQGLQMLVATMAERDPEAAWELAERLPKAMRNAALETSAIALAGQNPNAALAKLDSVKGTPLHMPMRLSIIGAMAKDDPPRAFALVNVPSPDGVVQQEDQNMMGQVFANWARKDMKTAQAALEKLEGQARNSAVGAIASTLAETDPAAAWKFSTENTVSSFEEYGGYDRGRYNILAQWVALDPKAALAAAASEENTDMRNNLLNSSIRSWAAMDYDAAYQHVMASTDTNVLASGLATMMTMPESNRMELFTTMLDRVPAEKINNNIWSIINQWSREKPREAAAAIEQLPPGNTYSNAAQRIASQWFANATDKNEPLQWVLSMHPGEARSNALNSVLRGWSNADPTAAAAFAMTLSNEERNNVMYSITSSWSQKDPQAALKWAASLPDENERKNTINNTLSRIADNNPQQAITMLNSLGMGSDANAVGNIVSSWASNDLNGASEWVKKLPDGNVRDNALGSVSQQLSGHDPETAIAWAQAIGDQNSRTNAISNIMWQWKRHDPEAAKSWVEKSNLPEDVKNRLLR